jgi:D-alanine transaminase
LQVTRGVAPRDHAFPPNITPTVFAYAQPLKYSPPEQLAQGVAAVTAADIRWQRCDIKAIALLANALLRQQAIDQGAVEAILVRDGVVTEGAASNIFVIKNGRLVTPPKGPFILPGITRDLVVEIARAKGIPCDELPVKIEALTSADEVWLTSSTKEILPITRIDGRPVGNGKPGPIHAKMFALYKEYKQAFIKGQAD